MNSKIVIGAVGCLALLGACSSTQRAQTTSQPAGTDFSRELARQYHGFAEQQRVEAFDYGSSGFFRRKGDTAARGTVVPPETVGQKFTPRDSNLRPELTSARTRLDTALASPATQRAATPLARAQVRYDCWLESTDDPSWAVRGEWLNRKFQECRSEFETAMADVDAAMRPPPAPVAAAPREQSLLVFFDFDRYVITPQGEAVIQRVVENYRRGGSAKHRCDRPRRSRRATGPQHGAVRSAGDRGAGGAASEGRFSPRSAPSPAARSSRWSRRQTVNASRRTAGSRSSSSRSDRLRKEGRAPQGARPLLLCAPCQIPLC